jgi:hypothetical protein
MVAMIRGGDSDTGRLEVTDGDGMILFHWLLERRWWKTTMPTTVSTRG